jgi:hypothetical protein
VSWPAVLCGLLAIDERIMSGGLVPVAVTSIEVKIIQLGEHGQLIGQIRFEAICHELIDLLDHLQPSRTFERMEVMGIIGTVIQISPVGLKKSATGGRFMNAALDAHRNPVTVGKCWALSQ